MLYFFPKQLYKFCAAKKNLEYHLEGLPSEITFSKILKKKLNHFRSLNLNFNFNCFLVFLVLLHTFNIFQLWGRNIQLSKKDLMTKS